MDFVERVPHQNWLLGSAAPILLGLAVAQGALSFSAGAQDYEYRRRVGLWIHDHCTGGASTMLEPIGYIGYFSETYIHDEVGLISPSVTDYRSTMGSHWWWNYIRDKKPTFVVEREQIFDHETFFGPIPEADYAAFMDDYELVQSFHYDPANYSHNSVLQRIAEMGSTTDYYVFQRKASAPVPQITK